MKLAHYLSRINYSGSLQPNVETLRALHRAHLLAISYENLDIHLGRRLELDERRIFEKLVVKQRGGWCYEMNGLFAWALRELGFQVYLLAGAVNRPQRGDAAEDGHLVLLVELSQPYLADVGFGDAFLEPLPLQIGEHQQRGFIYRLSRDGERWVLHNHQYSGGQQFDFTLHPRSLSHFATKCDEQQTSPTSGFVQKTVCYRFTPDRILSLRGAVYREVSPQAGVERVVETRSEYEELLRQRFRLQIDGVDNLWDTIWQRHLAWVEAQKGLG